MTTNRSNVLVLSDNTHLLIKFKELADSRTSFAFDYAYSYNNKSPSPLLGLGCRPLRVEAEIDRILSNYCLIISIHCKQIFPKRLVESIRCVNLHPGLNPYNRGWYPQVFSLINGKPLGATLHEMVADIDRGPVIAQTEIKVLDYDTSETAYQRVQEAETKLLAEWIDRVLSGKYELFPTDEGNYNSISDFRSLCRLDLNERMTLGSAIRLLRALSHPPHRNAYYVSEGGDRIYVTLSVDRRSTSP